jgi:hypothetical protein
LRLVYSEPQVATLQEVETYYSYLDILKAHEILDIKEEMKQEEIRKMNEANK